MQRRLLSAIFSGWVLLGGGWLLRAGLGARRGAAELVNVEGLGLRVPRGFRVSLYADAALANDIYAMTIDARSNVVVTSQGYVKRLVDRSEERRVGKEC